MVGITDNLKTIKLDQEDMDVLNAMAANGKQQRVNTPLFGWDLVSCYPFLARFGVDSLRVKGFHDWYGVGNKDAPNPEAVTVRA